MTMNFGLEKPLTSQSSAGCSEGSWKIVERNAKDGGLPSEVSEGSLRESHRLFR